MRLPIVHRIEDQELQAVFACAARMIEELGVLDVAPPGSTVVLKPNLFAPSPFNTGRTSDPRLVEGMCRRLMAEGVTPVIAEGSGNHYSGKYIFQTTGYRHLADSLGVKLVDLNEDQYGLLRLEAADLEVEYARTLLEAPVVVNVPKVKTHIQTAVTLSLKNLMGGLSKKGRVAFHFSDLHQSIPALSRTLMDRGQHLFCVADGIVSMEGKGPFTGEPLQTDFVLGARDPLTADLGLCHLMGFPPLSIEHIRNACALFGADQGLLDEVAAWAAGQRTFDFKPARSMKTGRAFASWGTWVAHLPVVDLVLYKMGVKPLVKSLMGREVATLDEPLCVGCLKCRKLCPMDCFTPYEKVVQIDTSRCAGCMICVEFCPEGALSMTTRRSGP